MFWPFNAWINCSSDLKNFANSRPSASNFKSFSRSLKQFFLTVGENNFGNKIPILFQVLLPVPDYVYTMLPLDQMKTMTFSITPVLFNVGINEKATLAHKMGLNAPQEKNNIDNFKALAEYYRRYKKLHLNTATNKNGKSNCVFFICNGKSKVWVT